MQIIFASCVAFLYQVYVVLVKNKNSMKYGFELGYITVTNYKEFNCREGNIVIHLSPVSSTINDNPVHYSASKYIYQYALYMYI